jgi:hypothetical protein
MPCEFIHEPHDTCFTMGIALCNEIQPMQAAWADSPTICMRAEH